MEPPKGLAAINHTYGNPLGYVNNKKDWETIALIEVPLRYELIYAYGNSPIYRIRAHRLVATLIRDCLDSISRAGVDSHRITYGGCYSWRAMRGSSKLSTHTWGIAIDIDPINSRRGLKWDGGKRMVPKVVVEIFKSAGFTWGGDFKIPDCMHFQYARGY